MNTIFAVMTVQALLGAFDNLWHHEWTARLPQRVSARRELALHAAREAIYGLLFIGFAWWRFDGAWAVLAAALLAAEVPAAVVNTLDRSLTDPQVLHRNMVLALAGPQGEEARVAGNPIKFTGEAEAEPGYPPLLGADNHEILRSLLGFGDEELAELERAGVFGKATGAASARKAG